VTSLRAPFSSLKGQSVLSLHVREYLVMDMEERHAGG
jgi:hypothetical protein